MKSFRAKVGITDKKYTVEYPVTVTATSFPVATARAASGAIRLYRRVRKGRRTSIVAVHIDLQLIGEVASPPSTDSTVQGTSSQPQSTPTAQQ